MTAKIPTADLKAELVDLAERLGDTPLKKDMRELGEYSAGVYHNRFGSWNDALAESGIPVKNHYGVSDDVLIDELQTATEERGRPPTYHNVGDVTEFSTNTYLRCFGSWNAALDAAGLSVHCRRNVSDGWLLDSLRDLADDLGRVPTKEDMDDAGEFGSLLYHDRFGSWNTALAAADFDLNHRMDIPRDELCDELARVADELGETPRMADMISQGQYSASVYSRQFGSWTNALEEVGLEVQYRMNVSREDLISGIHRLHTDLEKVPSVSDCQDHGEYNVKSYQRAFGSWDAAIVEAGYEPYEAPSGKDNPAWIDGGSKYDGYYGPNWDEMREKAIKRDGYQCALNRCDVTRESHITAHERDLPVHHIQRKEDFRTDDGTLDYERANALLNLITLCQNHHQVYEGLPIDIRHTVSAD